MKKSFLLLAILTCLQATQVMAGIESGLVASWTFDGCTFNDYSSYAHDGVSGGGEVTCQAGVKGEAISLSGDNYIAVPETDALPMEDGSSSYSISMWLNFQGNIGECTSSNIFQTLGIPLDFYSANDDLSEQQIQYGVELFCPSHSGWKYAYSTTFDYSTGQLLYVYPSGEAPIQSNRWYHIVYMMNRSNNEIEVYYNGRKGSGAAAPAGNIIPGGTSFFTIGGVAEVYANDARVASDRFGMFQGLIDEVRIYNRVITPSEITTLYNRSYINPEPQIPEQVNIVPVLPLLLFVR